VAQRSDTLRKLQLTKDKSVVDIGSGPGFLCESMADIVGPSGRVLGIDLSSSRSLLGDKPNRTQFLPHGLIPQNLAKHPHRRPVEA